MTYRAKLRLESTAVPKGVYLRWIITKEFDGVIGGLDWDTYSEWEVWGPYMRKFVRGGMLLRPSS